MKSKIITLTIIILMTVTNIYANDEPPSTETFLFGVNLAGTFTDNNLPELIQLSRKISIAKEAYSLLRSSLPDPSLATLPAPSQVINDTLDGMSVLDDYIAEATKKIQSGKVVNGIGDINISRAIQRISLGIGIASDIYSTCDILKKTMNGGASTTEKEKYIMNGTFSIIGLSVYLQPPPVASGVVFQRAGYIGLGYAALQLGAAWGEYVNGITVTDIIDDQVKNTLASLKQVDELTRIIFQGAMDGKTTEELNMLNLVILVKNNAISGGVESIKLLETPNAIISIIATGNVLHADNAKTLIKNILDTIASDQYSYEAFQDIYQAGRLAYLSNNALRALNQDDLSGSIINKNRWTLFLPAILAGAANKSVKTVTSATGRVWMDRNLGASRVATSMTDTQAYGDLYQWGRGKDGHEKRTSGTTTTLSSTDNPGHGNFITAAASPYDWRSSQNDNLWQGVSGINKPCPSGFRLPTADEWQEEMDSWSSKNAAGAFASPLKITLAGKRSLSTGTFNDVSGWGDYWASTVMAAESHSMSVLSSNAWMNSSWYRADALSVRCIKDAASTSLNEGLVAHYEFEDNANDSSGNGNNGVEYGGVSYVDGVIGKALYLSEANDYIGIENDINLQDFSLSFLVNIDKKTEGHNMFVQGANSSVDNEFNFSWRNSDESIEAVLSGLGEYSSGYNFLSKWTHVVYVNRSGMVKLYINGDLFYTYDLSGSDKNENIEYLLIGKDQDCMRGCFEDKQSLFGKIDDLRIYNRPITDSEIAELYNMGK